MSMSEEEARKFCEGFCDGPAMALLEKFNTMLAQENARQNLVSKASLENIWQRHIADSLQLLTHVPRETSCWLDLGTGAGLPGLIIAIARPELQMVLVESRRKRVDWLNQVIDELGLDCCHVEGTRLQNVESFEAGVICARAFAPLVKLLDLSSRFSTQETVWVLPKGRSGAQELAEQRESVRKMFHVEQSATDQEAAILVGRGRVNS